MPVLNSDIARSLDKLVDLLELDGVNPFRSALTAMPPGWSENCRAASLQ